MTIIAKDIKELINNEVIPLLKSHANEISILKKEINDLKDQLKLKNSNEKTYADKLKTNMKSIETKIVNVKNSISSKDDRSSKATSFVIYKLEERAA